MLGGILGGLFLRSVEQKSDDLPIGQTIGVLEISPARFQQRDDYVWGTGTLYLSQKSQEVKFSLEKVSENFSIENHYVMHVTGTLDYGEEAENFQGFSERNYLKEEGIYRVFAGQITGNSQVRTNRFDFLARFKVKMQQGLIQNLPPPLASFYLGTFLGIKDDYFYQEQLTIERSGLWIFFSFSGLQFYFLLEGFKYLCLRLGFTQEKTKILSLFFGALLLLTIGLKASLLRGLVFSALKILPRKYFSGLDRWSLTLFIGQLIFPYQLLGFGGQMSYLVTLLWVMPVTRNRKWQQLFVPLIITPLFWWHFFEWTPLLFFSFLFLRPVFTKGLTISLFLLGPLLLFERFADFIASIYQFLFSGLSTIQQLPLNWIVGRPPVLVLLLFYSLSFLLMAKFLKRFNKKYLFLLFGLFIFCSQWSRLNPLGEVTFINVRQGDSILLKSPFQQEVYLMDTGGRLNFGDFKGASIAEQTLIPYLKAQGIKKIHIVFASHGDADHIGDLLEVTQHFPIENIYLQQGAQQNDLLDSTITNLPPKTTARQLKENQQFAFSSGTLNFLGPVTGEGSNDDSVQFLLEVFDRQFLFTGDVEESGERNLLVQYPNLTTDILKIPHHGSATSTTEQFLDQLEPTLAIISCGKNNQYGHPAPVVLERLAQRNIPVLRTDLHGTIRFPFHFQGFKSLETLVSDQKK
ncbi:ComEC/Rec2 family competence protein [Enterococcus timonensis]|uniref:ComEC/Rec2 family competence protein n=1 Tax=Enterococcus timonensis TaxID=1852364 RepID=UPI00131A1592|nr:ComEC/Rec2 family competence protein [Enterococcus timonensis]